MIILHQDRLKYKGSKTNCTNMRVSYGMGQHRCFYAALVRICSPRICMFKIISYAALFDLRGGTPP
jgi:hypothetical protein